MWKIKIDGHLMPELYKSLRDAMDACTQAEKRLGAVITEVIKV